MKQLISIAGAMLLSFSVAAQNAWDYAIQLTATTQVSPAAITLKWKKVQPGTPVYYIFRKAKTAVNWGTSIATITTGDTTYTDNSVIVDSVYEYQITASGVPFSPNPSGYILAGIKAPAIHNRGALILLIDSTFTDSCTAELDMLMHDISGDGWQLIRHDLARTLPDTSVKAIVRDDYNTIPNVKAVYIVGHIAVPYSGQLNPDGHTDHIGAWPSDIYYASMTGVWTDVSINDISASNPANHNIPGDGHWDQTFLSAPLQLQMGRIDFNNMPAFSATEVQMMRRYLRKAHTYKMDSLAVRHRALINDNFGAFSGEAFAANGWRNFSPLVHFDSVSALPFIATLSNSSYQWAYGCGGGSYTSASGIGTTADFAATPATHAIFTMLFGSYFGDWNYQNSFLRAPLCTDTPALTSCWAGRPNWFLHHMAMGEPIGYGTMLTQNNTGIQYAPSNFGAGYVHITLIGDPTLRTDYINPPSNLTVLARGAHGASLTWTASPDASVIGYYVYRTDSVWGSYQKISPMLTTTSFTDTVGVDGLKFYMVRPVKLQSTPSGSYYNLGIGITDSATINFPEPTLTAPEFTGPEFDINVYPNPASDQITIILNSRTACAAALYLTDMAGNVFYPTTKYLVEGQNRYNLNVAELPSGNYILCINSGGSIIAKTWTKL
jgi:hypothetical protein